MRVALAQINTTVGDVRGNRDRVLDTLEKVRGMGAELVLFPELCLTGYPPRDLLGLQGFVDGNLRALRAMLGQQLDQTFTYDAHTVFVLWVNGVPHVISASQLVVGDRISVRIRAPRSFSLAQVEAVPANHVGDHEPGSSSP